MQEGLIIKAQITLTGGLSRDHQLTTWTTIYHPAVHP